MRHGCLSRKNRGGVSTEHYYTLPAGPAGCEVRSRGEKRVEDGQALPDVVKTMGSCGTAATRVFCRLRPGALEERQAASGRQSVTPSHPVPGAAPAPA